MKRRIRLIQDDRGGNRQGRIDADDEDARARLRHEQRGVDHQGADAIAAFREGVAEGDEILAAVPGDQAADVLDRHQPRCAPFGAKGHHELPVIPEGRRALAFETGATAGQGQLLTGETAPTKVGVPG